MYAFAIHDERSGDLTLARDPFGIKPLYVMPRGDGILFASELKAIVTVAGHELSVDPAAMVASTVVLLAAPRSSTPSGACTRHPAGTWAEYHRDGSVTRGTFWDTAAEAARAASGPRADVRGAVAGSVLAHLVADTPVASFLSGGLDSSIVTVLAHRSDPVDRGLHHRLPARGPAPRVDARRRALRQAPRRPPRLRLHEIEIHPDVVEMLPRMVDVLD
jgi:asparagine synthase (glutamine-hydrolysing)